MRKRFLLCNWSLVLDEDERRDKCIRLIQRFTDYVYSDSKVVEFDGETIKMSGNLRCTDGTMSKNITTRQIKKIAKVSGKLRKAILISSLPGMAMLDEIYVVTTVAGEEYYLFSSSASMETLELIAKYGAEMPYGACHVASNIEFLA